MKPMIALRLSACLICLTWSLAVNAQVLSQATPGGVNAVFVHLFGDRHAFSAKAQTRVVGPDAREIMSAPIVFSLLGSKIRVEVRMSEIKSPQIPALAAASFTQMGMDKVVSIVRPDKKVSYVIYPDLESYFQLPLTEEDVRSLTTTPKIDREPLGEASIDGRPCMKTRVTITDASGNRTQATTWNALAMNGFPLQMEAGDGTNSMTIRFKEVSFASPAARSFDLPAGCRRYDDAQDLVRGVMQKMMGDLGITLGEEVEGLPTLPRN